MRRSLRAASVGLAVLVVGIGGFTPAAEAADNAVASDWSTTVTTTESGVVVSQATDGVTAVSVYGTEAVEVSPPEWVTTAAGETELTVGAAPVADVTDTSEVYYSKSVYELLLASGLSKTEACEFAQEMDYIGCFANGEGLVAAAGPQYGDPICYRLTTYAGDGHKTARGCTTRFSDDTTTNYRYFANKMKVTGKTYDPGAFHDRINGVGIQVRYKASGANATDWSPYTTRTVGGCSTQGVSVTGKSGASYSTSTEVCSDKLSPWHSPEMQYFGAKWTGSPAPAAEYRGAVAASVHQVPRSQVYTASTYLWIRWS